MKRLFDRFHHEYWPWWLIYLPVVPLYLWQAVRLRRAAFFTNVCPAIDLSGFFGERKSDIYALLPAECYPKTLLVKAGSPGAEVLLRVHEAGITFPCIIKPDVGERGEGVSKVYDSEDLIALLERQRADLLVQQLALGEQEFGLMFARDPRSGRTELLSITGKRFLCVTGDGVSNVDRLLALTYRGQRQRKRLRTYAAPLLDRIPNAGEEIRVEPIGNHCRGTLFHDAKDMRTPALELAVDQLIGATTGIHYGRLDVRSESEAALRAGRFTVVELNGVSSEPGHIYDPSFSIWQCWSELIRHVRRIGPISEQLLAQGVEPASLRDLIERCGTHFGWRSGLLRRITSWSSKTHKPRPNMLPVAPDR